MASTDELHPNTEELLNRAENGDGEAIESLFSRHRDRLRRMVQARIDPRLAARVDPSDVVQDTLAEAHRSFSGFLRERPIAFYPWLRQIATNRLVDLYRRHIGAGARSIERERALATGLSSESLTQLAVSIAAPGPGPSQAAILRELQQRIQAALSVLPESDAELIVLRHVEQHSVREIADIFQIAEGTVKSRHFRALKRLRTLIDDFGEDS